MKLIRQRLRISRVYAHHVERDDEHRGPLGAVDRGRRAPCRLVPAVLIGLLVAYAARGGLEIIGLRADAARVDTNADEIVRPEAHIVGCLGRDDRRAGLLRTERHVHVVIVIQHPHGGLMRRSPLGRKAAETAWRR